MPIGGVPPPAGDGGRCGDRDVIPIVSLLLVIALSLLIVRIGAIALAMTGLSDEVARFQALSAFSGAGFTTAEAENVVSGPARRTIVATLIRAGSAGVVTAVSTLVLSLVGAEGASTTPERLAVLGAGIVVLVALARSTRLERWTRPLIERTLASATTLELRDYAGLLHLRDDYRVAEIDVEPGSWLAGRSLGALRLRAEGLTALGVEHADGVYRGAPDGETVLREGDRVVLYGRAERLGEISVRRGDDEAAHRSAVRREAERRRERAEAPPAVAGGGSPAP